MSNHNPHPNRSPCELIQEAIGQLSGVQLGLLRGEDLSEPHIRLPLQWAAKALWAVARDMGPRPASFEKLDLLGNDRLRGRYVD